MEITIFSISLVLYYAVHSLLVHPKIKSTLTNFIPSKLYRLFFNFIAISTLGGIVWYYFQFETPALFENKIVQMIGLILAILGGILVPISLNQYKLSEFIGTQQIVNSDAKNLLVTKGLNHFVRHPLYFSILLML